MAKDTTIDGYYPNDSSAWSELTTSGNFKFDKSTVTIVAYIGSDSSVVIPGKIYGIDVKRRKFTSTSNCKNLTDIIIPDSTTSIESIVCMNCSNLTSITEFQGCVNLTSVKIPNSVTSIANSIKVLII